MMQTVVAGQAENTPSAATTWAIKAMAYSAGRWTVGHDWVLEINVIDSQHSKPKVLTLGADPAWSPDGRTIAFCYNRSGEGSEIYTISADGSDRNQLTHRKGGSGACSPTWSPDGSRIAFSGNDGKSSRSAVFVMDREGSNVQRLTEGYWPQWSPDGKQLALFRAPKGPGNKSSVWVVNADGSQPMQLTDEKFINWEPSWTADGRILFSSNREGNSAIFVMSRDGTNLRKLAHAAKYDLYAPGLSPDGKLLVVDATAELRGSVILLLDLVGGEQPRTVGFGTHPSVVWTQRP